MVYSKVKIVVVAGPTASGKSNLAIALARKFNGEIISADSRQVYRGMDIGTGKVRPDRTLPNSKSETLNPKHFYSEGVRHHLLDVASPRTQYSVARWKLAAQKKIIDIVRRGKTPIICGGTGFWIDALVYDAKFPNVKPNRKLRARMASQPLVTLVATLWDKDPVRAKNIDINNRRRVIRALEIIEATGSPVPKVVFRSPYNPLYLAVSMDNETLRGRIAKRLDKRLKAGMIAEVRKLRASGVSYKRLDDFGLEYRWVSRYLKMKSDKLKNKNRDTKTYHLPFETLNYQQMRTHLLKDIIHYSKRQMTWWRKNEDIRWITGLAQAEKIAHDFLKI